MIYVSDEAGRDAICMRPFLNANGGKRRVSGAGAALAPRWRADEKEIFYVDAEGNLVSVSVTLGDQAPALTLPQVLFKTAGLTRASYAVTRDGTQFLVPVPQETSRSEAPLSVVLNWPTLFARK